MEILPERRYTRVVHTADLHLRASERHEEFLSVFRSMEVMINNSPEETLVVIVGDIFDSKQKIRPDTFPVFRALMEILLETGDVLVLAGNHDMVEGSEGLDIVGSVWETVNGVDVGVKNWFSSANGKTRAYHVQYTSTFTFGGVPFAYNSLKDGKFWSHSEHVANMPEGFEGRLTGLYHGCLIGCKNDAGYILDETPGQSSRHRSPKDFDGFPLVLLGDIHTHQTLSTPSGGRLVYPGSPLQQNHGERAYKGFVTYSVDSWGVVPDSARYHHAPNTHAFLTVKWNGGLPALNEILPIGVNNVRCRIIVERASQAHAAKRWCSGRFRAVNLTECKIETKPKAQIDALTMKRSRQTEMETLREMAGELTDKPWKLMECHENISTSVNWSWEEERGFLVAVPIRMNWAGLFGYGSRESSFTFPRGSVTAIIGENASGKSSLIHILMFALHGPSEGLTNIRVLNSSSKSGHVEVLLELSDGREVRVKRVGKRLTTGVTFSLSVDIDGQEVMGAVRDIQRMLNETLFGTRQSNTETCIFRKGEQTFVHQTPSNAIDTVKRIVSPTNMKALEEEAGKRKKRCVAVITAKEARVSELETRANTGTHLKTPLTEINACLDGYRSEIRDSNEECESLESEHTTLVTKRGDLVSREGEITLPPPIAPITEGVYVEWQEPEERSLRELGIGGYDWDSPKSIERKLWDVERWIIPGEVERGVTLPLAMIEQKKEAEMTKASLSRKKLTIEIEKAKKRVDKELGESLVAMFDGFCESCKTVGMHSKGVDPHTLSAWSSELEKMNKDFAEKEGEYYALEMKLFGKEHPGSSETLKALRNKAKEDIILHETSLKSVEEKICDLEAREKESMLFAKIRESNSEMAKISPERPGDIEYYAGLHPDYSEERPRPIKLLIETHKFKVECRLRLAELIDPKAVPEYLGRGIADELRIRTLASEALKALNVGDLSAAEKSLEIIRDWDRELYRRVEELSRKTEGIEDLERQLGSLARYYLKCEERSKEASARLRPGAAETREPEEIARKIRKEETSKATLLGMLRAFREDSSRLGHLIETAELFERREEIIEGRKASELSSKLGRYTMINKENTACEERLNSIAAIKLEALSRQHEEDLRDIERRELNAGDDYKRAISATHAKVAGVLRSRHAQLVAINEEVRSERLGAINEMKERRSAVDRRIETIFSQISEKRSHESELRGHINALENDKLKWDETLEIKRRIDVLNEEIHAECDRLEILELYSKLVGPKGVELRMLTHSLDAIAETTNESLSKAGCGYYIRFHLGNGISTEVIKGDIVLSPVQLSNFEEFALTLSVKRSLAIHGNANRCQFISVDEGLDCIDQERLKCFKNFLGMFTNDGIGVILISHLDITPEFADDTAVTSFNKVAGYTLLS